MENTTDAVQCRFEDRVAGRALVMHDACDCITASQPQDLDRAFAQIAAAQTRGHWLALLLDYELGWWLDPALAENDANRSASTASHRPVQAGSPRLTAWVFARTGHAAPWHAPVHCPRLHGTLGTDSGAYRYAIATLRAAMARGDFYQANYTFPIHINVNADDSLEHVYRSLANAHPSAHAVWFCDARRTILSFSPELFVARAGSTLTVRPMKGTAPRDSDPTRDAHNAHALLHSEKDRAENLMIVDLLRNDLGRIATPGSVEVASLFALEAYPSVWTMTSTVTAQAPHASLHDVLRALFPCGSITGAPKIAAMRALHALERAPRGIYCGSLGWLAPNGDFSLNVAIRTLEFPRTQAEAAVHAGRFGVGGGIVYDSRAEHEWQECLWKARVLGLNLESTENPQTLSNTEHCTCTPTFHPAVPASI